jgi:Tfp pilus assembly protein PilX
MTMSRAIRSVSRAAQKGVATLMVVLVLLFVLTIIVLASSNVALFEQRTATNSHRQQLAKQAAEYAITLGSEYLKANISKISTNVTNGWFDASSTIHWKLCPATPAAGHVCWAEPIQSRRQVMYYYTTDGNTVTVAADYPKLNLPFTSVIPSGAQLTSAGGTAFNVDTTTVRALLCLLDTPASGTPQCKTFETRTNGQRIAVTLVGNAGIASENANATVKQTFATYTDSFAVSAVPLAASGTVTGLGNATIVASPNAGGIGLPASIWAAGDVDVDSSGAGVGSVSTCHLGDYIGFVATESNYKTVCAANNDPCRCTVASTSTDFLSGHINGVKQENIDIADIDHAPWTATATPTSQPLPDISFFPGRRPKGTNSSCVGARASATSGYCRLDTASTTDDNLFEWIFNEDVNGGDFDGYPATATMDAAEVTALDNDFSAQHLANCDSLSSTSSGVYYIEGACNLPNAQIGTPDKPVIVVVNDDIQVSGSLVFYGMLFVRDTSTGVCGSGGSPPPACRRGTGGKFFGSVVVEGDVNLAGSPQLVYVTNNVDPKGALPDTTRFARVPGTWLDNTSGF